MNLEKLFEAQRELDNHIVKEKGLQGEDLLPKKILALQVELGELANAWRGFKFWSEDQKPRTEVERQGKVDGKPARHIEKYNPLLEEYVDCLHFATSIALELGINSDDILGPLEYKFDTTIDAFTELFNTIIIRKAEFDDKDFFCSYYSMLLSLGIMSLGFTWEQIAQAYFDKNQVNYERQENGY